MEKFDEDSSREKMKKRKKKIRCRLLTIIYNGHAIKWLKLNKKNSGIKKLTAKTKLNNGVNVEGPKY